MTASLVKDKMADSVRSAADLALIASSYPSDAKSPNDLRAEVNAVSLSDDSILWTSRATYDYMAVGSPYQSETVMGDPRIWCLLNAGEPSIAWTAGTALHISSLSDGHDIAAFDFPSNIVGVGHTPTTDGNDILCVATADGTLDVRFALLDDAAHGDALRATIPYHIDEAIMQWQQGTELLSIMHAIERPERLVVCRQDTEVQAQPREYSLDELLALAREALGE